MNKFLITVLIMASVYGCAMTGHRGEPHTIRRPGNGDAPIKEAESPPPNSYYYYAEAHLKRNAGRIDDAIDLMRKAVESDPGSLFLHVELASFHLLRKDTQSAIAILKKVLEVAPDYVPALWLYGRTLHALKEFEEAKQYYEKIIELDPLKEEVYLTLGDMYVEEKAYDRALEVYQQLVRYLPGSYTGHFFIGKVLLAQGKDIEAEKAFKRTIELAPDLAEPRFQLLEIYESRGDEAALKKLYEEILSLDPGNVQAAAGIGYLFHKSGQRREAEEILSDLGRQSLTDDDVVRMIIKLYLNEKKYAQGIIILEGMLKGAPESDFLNYVLGVAYSEGDDVEKSLLHLKRVSPGSEVYQKAAIHIALIYQERERLDEAIAHLKAVIENVPDDPEFFLYLGWFYEDKENYSEAEKIINQGLAVDPENAELLFRLGVIYDKWGKKDASIDAMKSVIHLDPENVNALNYLGYTYADLGKNLDEAERLVKKALFHKPDDGYITDSLGWVYYKKGLYDKALPLLQKAVELVPDDPIILEHLGDIYLKLGDRTNALKYYKQSRQHQNKDIKGIQKKIETMEADEKP